MEVLRLFSHITPSYQIDFKQRDLSVFVHFSKFLVRFHVHKYSQPLPWSSKLICILFLLVIFEILLFFPFVCRHIVHDYGQGITNALIQVTCWLTLDTMVSMHSMPVSYSARAPYSVESRELSRRTATISPEAHQSGLYCRGVPQKPWLSKRQLTCSLPKGTEDQDCEKWDPPVWD